MQNENFVTYDLCVLGFVFHVSNTLMRQLKFPVIEGLRNIENDDKTIINGCELDSPGPAVASVARYVCCDDLKLGSSIEEVLRQMSLMDSATDQHLFVFMDQFDADADVAFWGRLDAAMSVKKRSSCTVNILCFQDLPEAKSYFEKHDCNFRLCENYDEIKSLISMTKGFAKLNMEKVRREYECDNTQREAVQSGQGDEIFD